MNLENFIIPLITALPIYAGLWFTNRRLKPEVEGIEANTSKDMAEAGGKWLENYNRMFELLAKRDGELLDLRRQLGELNLEIAFQKKQAALMEAERDYYKGRLEEFQHQAEADRLEFNRQLGELRAEINHMKGAWSQNQ